jgi:hypothetical protein
VIREHHSQLRNTHFFSASGCSRVHKMGQLRSTPLLDTLTLAGALEEIIGLALDPFDESRHFRMSAKSIHMGVVSFKLSFCEKRMNLTVANAVKDHRLHTTARFRDQMVGITLQRRNWSVAQRANRRFTGQASRAQDGFLHLLAFDASFHK